MAEMGTPLRESGKTGRQTVRKNSDIESRVGQINSWHLEFPGGLGQWEAENNHSQEKPEERGIE